MIEALAEHLYLNDALKAATTQIFKNTMLLVAIHITMNFLARSAPAPHTATALTRVINGAGHRNNLVGIAGSLAQFV